METHAGLPFYLNTAGPTRLSAIMRGEPKPRFSATHFCLYMTVVEGQSSIQGSVTALGILGTFLGDVSKHTSDEYKRK